MERQHKMKREEIEKAGIKSVLQRNALRSGGSNQRFSSEFRELKKLDNTFQK
jgi:hypothetical protein